jgi:hypothetical protein
MKGARRSILCDVEICGTCTHQETGQDRDRDRLVKGHIDANKTIHINDIYIYIYNMR